jgi:glutathione S-transferase
MRDNGAAPATMQNIHPIRTAPLIRDGEHVVKESGAIVEYIINRYGDGQFNA